MQGEILEVYKVSVQGERQPGEIVDEGAGGFNNTLNDLKSNRRRATGKATGWYRLRAARAVAMLCAMRSGRCWAPGTKLACASVTNG